MSTYACSDLHGNWNLWCQIKKFLKPEDTLYFLGDAADRGPDGWAIIKEMIEDPRVIYIAGNHDIMLADRIARPNNYEVASLHSYNGGYETWAAAENDPDILYIMNQIYKMPRSIIYTNIYEKSIFMSHSGSTSSDPYDLVWDRHEFYSDYIPEGIDYIIHGHTPIPYLLDKLEEFNSWLPENNRYSIPVEVKGVLWYRPWRCDLDRCTIVTKDIVLLNLDTFEEHLFSEDE